MSWFTLVIWIIAGILNFVNRKSDEPAYWKIMYWICYFTLLISLISNYLRSIGL